MTTYIIRRLLQTAGLLALLSILLFALVNLAPGGPLAGRPEPPSDPGKIELMKRQFGLDKPLPAQYLIWLIGNDWMQVDKDGDGVLDSYGTRQEIFAEIFDFIPHPPAVLKEIGQRFPNTIYLTTVTMLVAVFLRDSNWDYFRHSPVFHF